MNQLNYLRIMIRVVILGSGNVAFHLTKNLLNNKKVQVIQVYNRTLEKINYLESITSVTNDLNSLKNADIYIISVTDNAISKISSQLKLKNKLVVHTSGSAPLSALKSNSNKGVLYFLQTFTKEKNIEFNKVPVCIETEDKKDFEQLESFAKLIVDNVYPINTDQRNYLHVAAVFVNNFVNHLIYLGYGICDQRNVPFELLHPLIEETFEKITNLAPIDAQTGPARRNDLKTIEKQMELLPKNQQEIYKLLTKSIIKTYGEKL